MAQSLKKVKSLPHKQSPLLTVLLNNHFISILDSALHNHIFVLSEVSLEFLIKFFPLCWRFLQLTFKRKGNMMADIMENAVLILHLQLLCTEIVAYSLLVKLIFLCLRYWKKHESVVY